MAPKCVRIAPFGRPVVPEVYRMQKGSSSAAVAGTGGCDGIFGADGEGRGFVD
jgi:hypothetical protein